MGIGCAVTLAAFAFLAFVEGMFLSQILLWVGASFKFYCLVKECDILDLRFGNQKAMELSVL